MEVFADGERIFDKKAEGVYPDLARVRQMRLVIDEKMANAMLVPADD